MCRWCARAGERAGSGGDNSGFDEGVAALPLLFEAGPDGGELAGWNAGVWTGGEAFCLDLGQFQGGAVAQEVGDSELGQAGLAGAEELARAALGEVEFGQGESVLRLDHCVEAKLGLFSYVASGHQYAEALRRSAAYAAAELVHLREAEALCVVDDHDGGVGDIDADLDDGGGDQDIDLSAMEAGHGYFLFVGAEAAVEKTEAETGERAGAEVVEHLGGGAEICFGDGKEIVGFGGFFLRYGLRG